MTGPCGCHHTLLRPHGANEGDWSSGMIPALGAGGREFDSRITPFDLASEETNEVDWRSITQGAEMGQTKKKEAARCGARTRD
jgi:hypothetical protein